MIKLLVFDLDDTLLNSKKEITLDTINAIKKAKSEGLKIVFASGRPICNKVYDYYKLLGINDDFYYVGFNGEAVYRVLDGVTSCVYCNKLNNDDILDIENKLLPIVSIYNDNRDVNIARYVYVDNKLNFSDLSEVIATSINKYVEIENINNAVDIIIDNLSCIKYAHKYMVAGNPSDISEIYGKLDSTFKDKYEVCISMPCFIEILKKGSNKYSGVVRVAKELGISSSEIMAFGDSMNDYELIKSVGFGVAMGNSIQKIKDVGKYVTTSNDLEGVSKVITKYILRRQ